MNDKLHQIDGKFYQETQVVMLLTNKQSQIWKNDNGTLTFYTHKQRIGGSGTPMELYFLSDEEIKEGNVMLHPKGGYMVGDLWQNFPNPIVAEEHWFPYMPSNKAGIHGFKKIIATTNSELNVICLKCGYKRGNNNECKKCKAQGHLGIARPSNLFIEKFVTEWNASRKIDKVLFELEKISPSHPMNCKFESDLDVFYKLKIVPDNTITIKQLVVKDSWTREQHCNDMQYYMEYCQSNGYVTPMKWLNELKHY